MYLFLTRLNIPSTACTDSCQRKTETFSGGGSTTVAPVHDGYVLQKVLSFSSLFKLSFVERLNIGFLFNSFMPDC